MRRLDPALKLDLIRQDRPTEPPRGRPRSLNASPVKRSRIASFHRSRSRPRSEILGTLDHAMQSTSGLPSDFIADLRRRPQQVEVGKVQKLKQMLRNETVEWVNSFIAGGGMHEIVDLCYRILDLEWREEHEDTLLHETLACLKALTTTSMALDHLSSIRHVFFPRLLALLFSEEKKGPSEFTTRGIIVALLMTQPNHVLEYLQDPKSEDKYGFITTMHQSRPYRRWCKEMTDVTKEVFWIFLHQTNVISSPCHPVGPTYAARHFPRQHAPKPTAPYVGGVEWEATTYLTGHLDLVNAILATLPTKQERTALRRELRDSGFEKMAGGSLRTCKEKFYGHIHEALATWIEAAREDQWDVSGVQEGNLPSSPCKSPTKQRIDQTPVLALPKLDLGLHL